MYYYYIPVHPTTTNIGWLAYWCFATVIPSAADIHTQLHTLSEDTSQFTRIADQNLRTAEQKWKCLDSLSKHFLDLISTYDTVHFLCSIYTYSPSPHTYHIVQQHFLILLVGGAHQGYGWLLSLSCPVASVSSPALLLLCVLHLVPLNPSSHDGS